MHSAFTGATRELGGFNGSIFMLILWTYNSFIFQFSLFQSLMSLLTTFDIKEL